MSTRLYGRGLRLRIDATGATGREITGLRVACSVERGEGVDSAHNATLTIWNAAPETRALLAREGAVVEVLAGYGSDTGPLPRLILGDVTRVTSVRDGTDRITEVSLRDAGRSLSSSVVSLSLSRGRLRRDAIEAVAVALSLELVDDLGLGVTALPEGLSVVAPARSVLRQLLQDIGAEASISDGRLRIYAASAPQVGARVEEISASTGLVGAPAPGADEDQAAGRSDAALTFTFLLRPLLRPGDVVSLVSEVATGLYRIRRLAHEIDTHDAPWYTTVEGRRIT